MKGVDFKSGIFKLFKQKGFDRRGAVMMLSGSGVTALIGVDKGFGSQWFINVGFCFHRLGRNAVDKIEQADMYFRLERLFPRHRDVILGAGDFGELDQPDMYQMLLKFLEGEIVCDLKILCDEKEIFDAYGNGRFIQGMVSGGARDLMLAGK